MSAVIEVRTCRAEIMPRPDGYFVVVVEDTVVPVVGLARARRDRHGS